MRFMEPTCRLCARGLRRFQGPLARVLNGRNRAASRDVEETGTSNARLHMSDLVVSNTTAPSSCPVMDPRLAARVVDSGFRSMEEGGAA